MKKRLLAVSLLTSSLLFSCNNYSSVIDSNAITLTASTLVLKIGEELTLKSNLSDGEVVYSSSNESVATVSEKGVVKGLSVGEVTITGARKDDLKYKSKITLNVVDDDFTNKTETKKELVLDSLPTLLKYDQGSTFSLDGLKVSLKETDENGKVTTKEVKDYVTNPKSGELLANVGKFTATVSYLGADSKTFEYEVVSAPVDESLSKVLESLEYADKFMVSARGKIGSSALDYKEYYDDYCYYLENGENKVGYAYQYSIGEEGTASYHDRGVFEYRLDEKGEVVPGSYINHSSWGNFEGFSYFNEVFDYELAPKRSINGYFTINDSETNEKLMTYLGLSGYGSYVSKLKFKVLDEMSFEVYLTLYQGLGEVTFTVSKIDDPNGVLPKVTAYLDDEKGGLDTYNEVIKVQEALKRDHYKFDMGNVTVGSVLPMTYHMGYVYYTPNYLYFDYSEDYLKYLNETKDEETPTYTDTGKIYDGSKVYNFTVVKENGQDKFVLGEEDTDYNDWYTFPEYYDYFSSTDAFNNDNLDLYKSTKFSIDGNNVSLYALTDSEIATSFGKILGYGDYDGYGVGLGGLKYSESKEVSEFDLYYFFVYGADVYCTSHKIDEIGTAKAIVVENFISSLD